MRSNYRYGLLAAASLLAFAASEASAAEPTAEGIALPDVVVTARRTQEAAQTVPITLSAVSAAQMRRNNIQNIADVQHVVPGLTVNQGVGGAATVALAIRGQVAGDNLLTVDPAVGVYIDEVLVPRGVGLRPAQFDLASVEVLEGPQGTLFGKNTTGGALVLSTTRPHQNVGGYVDAQFTTYNGIRTTAAIDLPLISDKLLTRIAVSRVTRDGFGHDARGADTNSENMDAVRASVIWRPDSDVEVFGSFEADRSRARPENSQLAYVNGCTGPNQCSGVPLTTALGSPLPRYDASGNLIPGTYGLGLSATVFSEVVAEQGLAQTSANQSAAQTLLSTFLPGGSNFPGFYNTANALQNTYDNFNGASGTLQVNVTKFGHTFRSITGYRFASRKSANLYSPFNIPGPTLTTLTLPDGVVIDRITAIGGFLETHSHSFTQEFQVQRRDSHFLEYTLGAFFQSEVGDDGGHSLQAPALSPAAAPVVNDGYVRNKSASVYGQFIYHVLPTVRLTGGVRFTRDDKSIDAHTGSGIGPPFATGVINAVANPALATQAAAALLAPGENCTLAPTLLPSTATPYLTVITAAGTRAFYSRDYSVCTAFRRQTFSSVNWLASVDWRPTDRLMFYGKVATGYKGGGFNLRLTNAAGLTPFQPETTIEYEVGLKSTWLDGRLRVNADTYYTDYSNIQRNQVVATVINGAVGTASVIGNAAKAKIYGVEATASVVPLDGLTLSASFSWMHAKYTSYRVPVAFDSVTGAPTAYNDLSYLSFPLPTGANLPAIQYSLTADYQRPIPWGRLTLTANWSWQSEQPYPDIVLKQFLQIHAYGLLNLQAAVHVDSIDTTFSVFARNALNQKYFTGFNDTSASFGYSFNFTGEPVVVGLGVRKEF